ncbi:MAG: orotidine-5'-phosphate decarboxylase [Firmicutes bacterium]|nr:orotidine-5'-phosphate decarboxylase [Bacillota bacterium]
MSRDVIIACDFAGREELMSFLDRFGDRKPFVKIGMELFYSCGPDIVRELKGRGHKVFLDLKLHDIPNTVEKAMRSLSKLDVDMCNVHAGGGKKMMEAAVRGLTREDGSRPIILAVTQLTSTDERMMREELLINRSLEEVVEEYGKNTAASGIDGVVCSPLEAGKIHRACGDNFLTVTPGVRLAGDSADDQKRVTTPAKARELGSDYIVVGRSITKADNPLEAYERCCREFKGENMKERVAEGLLEIGAVFLRPDEPFTWASGIKSPVYCDNRLILTSPHIRDIVENAIAETVKREYPEAEVLMGTSTAGIAHAAIAGHLMNMPAGYVRSGNKDHGRNNKIEGKLEPGQKVVVVEDLISTAGSAITTVEALKEAGAEVLGIVSIFTYGMKEGLQKLEEAGVKNVSLTDFETVAQVALRTGYIKEEHMEILKKFINNPREAYK